MLSVPCFFGGNKLSGRDEAKQIQATINKTYAYFNSVLSSLVSSSFLISGYNFYYSLTDYLSYHGIDDPGGKAHNIDLKTVIISGIVTIAILLVLIFFVKAWMKRIKALDKKTATVVISLILYIVLLPIFAYCVIIF